MKSMILAFALLTAASLAQATTASVSWPSRNSQVLCGGTVDNEDLQMRMVIENELLAGDSVNGRVLLYIDLHRPGQARVVVAEGFTDSDYEKREAALAKLSPEEAALLRGLSASRQADFYLGFSEGYFHLTTASGERTLSLSCQEIPN